IPGATGSGTNLVTVPAGQVPSAGMSINLGDRADLLTIGMTAHAISVKGGADNDTINVGQFGGGDLYGIAAPVTVDGEADTDTVNINDTASEFDGSYTVTASRVTANYGAVVNYVGTENLTVNGSTFGNGFVVQSTAAGMRTTLNGSVGGDTFTLAGPTTTL